MTTISHHPIIKALIPAVLKAGEAIMDIRARGVEVMEKADASPVTEADQAAEKILIDALLSYQPDAKIVAEEQAAAGILPENISDEFWLIDPLDGTKEFIKGGSDFTVNIALIKNHRPSLGIVYTPAQNRMFIGVSGHGACEISHGQEKTITIRGADTNALDVVASKSHRDAQTDTFLDKLQIRDLKAAGSSLKFCLVAAGEADIYPRFGPTMEWDTAAGQAVLEAAGGAVYHPNGDPYLYAKAEFKNPPFIAIGDPALKTLL